ncbi:MAG TPA: mechanosensitive ion channel family protein [Acidimicrobiales bacterium]|nr:mechanosensitive ion channel family protein [Acidimicrobiales bacterium]
MAEMFHTSDISYWARSNGLEIVLIGLGSVLVVRFTRWVAALASWRLGQRVRAQIDAGQVPSEQSKHLQVAIQATEWCSVVLIYFLAAVMILLRLHLPLASLVAPASVAGVALGFGAQTLVRDLLTGFFLFAEHQYGLGDWVRIDQPGQTNGISGEVEELTLRTTRLRTVNGELVVIPNGEIRQVTNLSVGWSRAVVDIPLAPDQDLERVSDLLRELGQAMMEDPTWKSLLLEAPSVTGLQAIEVGYLQLRVMARTLPGQQWAVGREIRRRAIRGFHEAGIAPPKALYMTQTGGGG